MKAPSLLVLLPLLLSISIVPRSAGAPVSPEAEERIDFDRARTLMQKRRGGARLTSEEAAYLERAIQERTSSRKDAAPLRSKSGPTVGFKPLTEMTAEDHYEDQEGGLYGEGRNTPPDAHRKAAEQETAQIQPLDTDGNPSKEGKVCLISISMSNATQEFSMFKRRADDDPAKSASLAIVDCAQGGQAMAEWVNPNGEPWREASRRIDAAKVSDRQVQIAWIKLANKSPRGDLREHGEKLRRDTTAVLRNAKARFPNLRIVYLGSRIYAGFGRGPLNPEPYAYESGFVCRWLIQDQIKGSAELNYDSKRGPVKAPLLLWGPYLWADGVTPRKQDGLVWNHDDFAQDGIHPSQSGREKVARLLLDFFKTDALARTWFALPRQSPASRP